MHRIARLVHSLAHDADALDLKSRLRLALGLNLTTPGVALPKAALAIAGLDRLEATSIMQAEAMLEALLLAAIQREGGRTPPSSLLAIASSLADSLATAEPEPEWIDLQWVLHRLDASGPPTARVQPSLPPDILTASPAAQQRALRRLSVDHRPPRPDTPLIVAAIAQNAIESGDFALAGLGLRTLAALLGRAHWMVRHLRLHVTHGLLPTLEAMQERTAPKKPAGDDDDAANAFVSQALFVVAWSLADTDPKSSFCPMRPNRCKIQ